MRTFMTRQDDAGRVSNVPTPEFEALLKRDFIAQRDLRVFDLRPDKMERFLDRRGYLFLRSEEIWARAVRRGEFQFAPREEGDDIFVDVSLVVPGWLTSHSMRPHEVIAERVWRSPAIRERLAALATGREPGVGWEMDHFTWNDLPATREHLAILTFKGPRRRRPRPKPVLRKPTPKSEPPKRVVALGPRKLAL